MPWSVQMFKSIAQMSKPVDRTGDEVCQLYLGNVRNIPVGEHSNTMIDELAYPFFQGGGLFLVFFTAYGQALH